MNKNIDKPVIIILAGYLDFKAIVRCSGVCNKWYKWFNLQQVWKITFHSWFGQIPKYPTDWKLAFKQECIHQKNTLLTYETRKKQNAFNAIPSHLRPGYIEPTPPPDNEPIINMGNHTFKKRTKIKRTKKRIIKVK